QPGHTAFRRRSDPVAKRTGRGIPASIDRAVAGATTPLPSAINLSPRQRHPRGMHGPVVFAHSGITKFRGTVKPEPAAPAPWDKFRRSHLFKPGQSLNVYCCTLRQLACRKFFFDIEVRLAQIG